MSATPGIPWQPPGTGPSTPGGRRSIVAADLVVDASGRRTRGAEWLPELGARVGWLELATFPGDRGTFSITVAA